MLGYVDNCKARYVYILPSLFEGFPLSLLEALAEGTCVIASNVGGIKEIIRIEEIYQNTIKNNIVPSEEISGNFDETGGIYESQRS